MSRKKTHPLIYKNLIALHLNKLEFPSSKDALCQDWLKFCNSEENFLICQCIFAIWLLSPLEKERGPSFKQT